MVGSAAYSATSIVVVMAKDKGRGSKGAKGGGASSGQVNPLPPPSFPPHSSRMMPRASSPAPSSSAQLQD